MAVVEALEKERVPVVPILTLNEAMVHPHLRQRGTMLRPRFGLTRLH